MKLIAAIILALLFLLVTHFFNLLHQPMKCDGIPEFRRLKLGDQVFTFSNTDDLNTVPDIYPHCFRDGDPPIEVTHFSSQFEFASKSARYPQILADYMPDYSFKDPFDEVQSKLSQAHIKLTDLPVDSGFYVWDKVHASIHSDPKFLWSTVYIAKDPTLRSPNGKPAIVECFSAGSCMPRTQTGNVGFIMRFPAATVPASEFGQFYQELENRIRRWEANPPNQPL